MLKIITWIMANGATLLGLLQAVIKAIKELLTGVVNLISLFLPQATANKAVEVVRGVLNAIDDVIEKIKGYLLK
jgi:phage-related protein